MKKQFKYLTLFSMAAAFSFSALASCNGGSGGNEIIDPETVPETPADAQALTFNIGEVQFKMIAVQGGTFVMGSTDADAPDDQKPAHRVTLSDFHIGQTEVTQALWSAVMGSNPSQFRDVNRPVDNVTWEACRTFAERLTDRLRQSGQITANQSFRLPTEAQWEYAARGGNKSKGYTYAGSNDIDAVAWTRTNTNRTHPVASKTPNELGLYDMSGNVWEWVEDYYAPYAAADQTNPVNTANQSSGLVIKRGGSWYYSQQERFRPAYRYGYYTAVTDSSIGVRLALVAE